jgi:hypothetical protein
MAHARCKHYRAKAHTSVRAPTPTPTNIRTRMHSHASAGTPTQIYAILIAFPRQQCFRERA